MNFLSIYKMGLLILKKHKNLTIIFMPVLVILLLILITEPTFFSSGAYIYIFSWDSLIIPLYFLLVLLLIKYFYISYKVFFSIIISIALFSISYSIINNIYYENIYNKNIYNGFYIPDNTKVQKNIAPYGFPRLLIKGRSISFHTHLGLSRTGICFNKKGFYLYDTGMYDNDKYCPDEKIEDPLFQKLFFEKVEGKNELICINCSESYFPTYWIFKEKLEYY